MATFVPLATVTNRDKLTTKDRSPVGTNAVIGPKPDGAGLSSPPVTSLDLSAITGALDLQAIEALASTGYAKRTGSNAWALASTIPWTDISSTPTTLAGYGIVNGQPLATILTTLSALSNAAGVLTNNGSGGLSWAASGGSGDVVGPSSATDNAIARFDGTTGKLIQNSGVTIADSGVFTASAGGVINGVGLKIQTSAVITDSVAEAQLTVKNSNTNGHASVVIDKGSDGYSAGFGFLSAGSSKWDAGLLDDTNFTIRDTVNNRKVFKLTTGAPVSSFEIGSGGAVRLAAYGAGTLTTDGSGNITASSDEGLKTEIQRYTRGLEDILGIEPISFRWKKSSGLDRSQRYHGFSAQNVLTFIPEAVGVMQNGDLTLQERPILAAVINALHELAARVEAMENS